MVLILGISKRLLDRRATRRAGCSSIDPRRSSYPFGVRALQLGHDVDITVQQPCHAVFFDREERHQAIISNETSPTMRERSSRLVKQLPIIHDLDLDYLASAPRLNIGETGQLYRRDKPLSHRHPESLKVSQGKFTASVTPSPSYIRCYFNANKIQKLCRTSEGDSPIQLV